MIRRICFYGGPGSGKSTLAPEVFSAMKKKHWRVEQAREEIKERAYKGDFPKGFEQLDVFSDQLHDEERWLWHVDMVVTDSPLLMNASYSKLYGFEGWQEIVSLSKKFEKTYPAINFYLSRRFPYQQEGRYQTEEEAHAVDEMILGMMNEHLPAESIVHGVFDVPDVIRVIEERRNG